MVAILDPCIEHTDDTLGGGQVAGAHDNNRAFTGVFEEIHLLKGSYMVHSRVGAGVGQKNHAAIEFHSHTIRHQFQLSVIRFCIIHQPLWRRTAVSV